MQANYRVTEDDLLAVSNALGARSRFAHFFIGGATLSAMLSWLLWHHQVTLHWPAMLAAIAGGGFGGMLPYGLRFFLLRRRQLRRLYGMPAYGAVDRRIDVSEDGITFSDADSSILLRWQRIASWFRSGSVIILRTRTPRQTFFIPCAIAEQGVDLAALTRLLSEKVTGARR